MGKADYLAKYYSAEIPGEHGPEKRKKKRRRRHIAAQPSRIKVVDEDAGWPVQTKLASVPEAVNDGDESDDGPVVENAAEVHHQLQLLQGQAKFRSQWESEDMPLQPEQQQDSDDGLPPRGTRHDTDDESPPRRQVPASDGLTPQVATRNRHDSDNDLPPSRAHLANEAAVSSQQQSISVHPTSRSRKAQLSVSVLSHTDVVGHARQQGQRWEIHHHDDESPPRRPTARHGVDDESPPRRRKPDSVTDAHVEQRRNQINREAVKRKIVRHDSDDESPPRTGVDNADPMDGNERNHRGPCVRMRHGSDSPVGSPSGHEQHPQGRATAGARLGQGGRATGGLVESHIMSEQIRQKRLEEQQRILEMDPSKSGRGASSTFRLDGKIVTKEEYKEAMVAKQTKRQPKYLEEDVEWKSGLAQRRAKEAEKQALERESTKKFQREFDEDADVHMQQELRMDDPMAQYFTAKQRSTGTAESNSIDAHAEELSTKSGFIIPQAIPHHSWSKRGVQPLPNRFNIKPGRHWDGVHRGNGFEQKFVFQYQHNKAERERDRYVLAEDL